MITLCIHVRDKLLTRAHMETTTMMVRIVDVMVTPMVWMRQMMIWKTLETCNRSLEREVVLLLLDLPPTSGGCRKLSKDASLLAPASSLLESGAHEIVKIEIDGVVGFSGLEHGGWST